jgi:hypothetical protein
LKPVLHNIISENQNGFIKGRYIGDNIRALYDIMNYTNVENVPGMLLLIDFEKAFDSLSWNFIQKCLKFFNFGLIVQKFVRTLYNDASSCVQVNGQYSSWFGIRRGVRQGDPCSPYIYLICAEILSLIVKNTKGIKGIKVKNTEYLLSQFADDTAFCLDGSEQSFCECIRVLDLCHVWAFY